jgi:transposase InsO family protein
MCSANVANRGVVKGRGSKGNSSIALPVRVTRPPRRRLYHRCPRAEQFRLVAQAEQRPVADAGDYQKSFALLGSPRHLRFLQLLVEAGTSIKATTEEVVGKIIYLRQNYHFGPHKIAMYLKRYHEIDISPSGVWRILKRLGMSRLPSSQRYKRHKDRWKRYEKPQPGHRVQIDVKFIAPLAGARKKHYQFTAIDDCTRLRVLRIYDRLNQKTAIQFVDYVLEKLPFRVEVIQTDNGSEFQAGFHWHVLDRGIQHIYIKPATPRLNGKVERSHRIDGDEFYRMLDGMVVDDTKLFNTKLQEWEHFYNFERPHGALGGQTPYERLRQKTTTPV